MDRLHMKEADCKYKEYDRRLTVQFINSLDHEIIIEEIIRELTALKYTSEVSSDQVLMQVLDNIKNANEFDSEKTSRCMIILDMKSTMGIRKEW